MGIDPPRPVTYDLDSSVGVDPAAGCSFNPGQVMSHFYRVPRCFTALVFCVVLALSGCQQESIPHVEGIEVALNDENFQAEALQSEIPVLVDFGASWCGPCRQMEPAVAYLSVQYRDRVKVGKVDVDASPSVTSEHNVDSYPTFVLFKGGEEIARTVGGRSYRDLSRWVDRHTGG